MPGQVTWHGTQQESLELVNAIWRNCTCEGSALTAAVLCPCHRMLREDQRALDGLLFARRIASRLRGEEWITSASLARAAVRDG